MRVIGGEFRGRTLKSLPGLETRPTPDRLRESLFNILAPEIEDAVFLDAYAGTGAVGIEALSRGASRCIFIERSRAAVVVIRENLASMNLSGRAEILQGKSVQHVARRTVDIVFADPPYALEDEYRRLMNTLCDIAPPLLLVQHSSRFRVASDCECLRCTRVLQQGDNAISFFRPCEPVLPELRLDSDHPLIP